MPASSVRPFATPARKGVIFSAVTDSDGTMVSQYAETTNVPDPIKFIIDGPVASGACGDDVDWTLYRSGKLVVSGTGDMDKIDGIAPWRSYVLDGYNISELIIDEGITSISDYAFESLIYFPDGNYNIEEAIGLKKVIIPDSVVSIGNNAFQQNLALETVVMANGIEAIGAQAFDYCPKLKDVNIPDSVKTIGAGAFRYCRNLTSLSIPDSVTGIDILAFVGCTSLTNVYFAGTEEQWNAIGYSDWDEPAPTIYFNHPDHVVGEWETKTVPDCIHTGIDVKKCTICGEEIETQVVSATGIHNPGEWETKTEPTCTGEGVSVKKCTVCKAELETQPIDATGHTPGEWETKTEPTCTGEGVSAKKCTVCKAELETQPIDATGHTSGEWETKTEPTCTGEGVSVKKCTVCKAEVETASIAPLGHTAGEWETKTEPTCMGEGISVKKCTVCKAELETQPIDALGHTPGEWETKTEPTCTDEGVSVKKCTVCKAEVETAPIDALGHSAGEWKITTYPTTTEEGVKTLYCSVCGDGYNTIAMPVLDAICDYLTWEITDEGYAEITGYKDGIAGDITLPSTIYGYPVIIGDGAFAGCGIIGVTIPEGVSTIGECAFAYCTRLVTVNLPTNLENLDYSAFIGSTNIESIVINENNPFYCTDENGIIYNKGKTRLIYAPAKSVGEAYVMPETVITADEFAFADCTDFSLTLSDGFHIDSDNAFFFMVSVNEFVTNESNIYYKAVHGVLYSEDGLTLIKYPVDSKRELFVLPDNVSSVANMNAFVVYEAEQAAIYYFDLPCDNNTYDFYKEPEYLTVHVNTFDSLDSESLSNIIFGTSHICIGDITAENMKSLNAVADNAVANIESQWLEEKDKYTPGTNAYYFNKAMILGYVDIIASFIDCNNDHSFLHKYADVLDYLAPTCTQAGYGDYSCECGYSFHKDYEATGHDYEEEITVKVGCTTAGKKTFTCHCGDTYSEIVPATGHSLKKSHIDPTCITDSKDCYVCANCLSEFSVKILPATGHTESDWEVKSEPSCEADGIRVKKCTDCGEELETEHFGEATGRSYEEETVTEPTCTAEGEAKYTCHCGDSYMVSIPVLDHDTVRYYTAPTCLEPGMEYYLCNSCGNMIGDMEIIPETGHIYEWVVDTAPTVTESGSKTQHCTGCDETGETKTIPATGFEPINGMVVDYADNTVYGFVPGIDSIDNYTNIVADGCEWVYEPGQYGFGTGTKAILKNGDEIIGEYTIVIFGDIQGDGWYDGEDAFLVNLIVAGLLTQENLPDYMWTAADCNHDGVINEVDVDLLMGAGLRKNDIDQNSDIALSEQSAYIEYAVLIDQSAGLNIQPDMDDAQQGTTPEPNETVDSATEDDIDFEVILANILEFFKKLFALVFSFIIK